MSLQNILHKSPANQSEHGRSNCCPDIMQKTQWGPPKGASASQTLGSTAIRNVSVLSGFSPVVSTGLTNLGISVLVYKMQFLTHIHILMHIAMEPQLLLMYDIGILTVLFFHCLANTFENTCFCAFMSCDSSAWRTYAQVYVRNIFLCYNLEKECLT